MTCPFKFHTDSTLHPLLIQPHNTTKFTLQLQDLVILHISELME
jgi:hypothetical protein